jgi:hypothetical protein
MSESIKLEIKSRWKDFDRKYPKYAKLIFQFIKFYLFSVLVTILQYLLLTFLPEFIYSLTEWNSISFQAINIRFWIVDTYVFDYPVTGDPTGGLGYFIAFATTLFIAQCVNFPLQRNITFKSKGNIAYQIMWYFIAWVLITFTASLLASIYVPILKEYLTTSIYNIIITIVNGGVQMVIYFPIFKIIFPEEA